MKLISTCLFFLLLSSSCLIAQYKVKGTVIDDKNQALSFANIVLSIASDSTFVNGTTSDLEGYFELEIPQANVYLLTISTIGYSTYTSSEIRLNEQNTEQQVGPITLSSGGLQLTEVEVVATKPIFERKIDRTIINLENRVATAGASALEVLEQSPGVVVNQVSGVIGMLGKEGVNIMINGKLNYMPSDALLQFLGGLDANNILKIELITTPPAQFDAQGNAGFINLVLKNNPKEGLQGSYALTGGYGKGTLGSANLSLNYRKEKVNLFGNYSFSHNDQRQFTTLDRRIFDFQTRLAYDRDPSQNNQNARLGVDYQVGENTVIGVLLAGYINKFDMDALNTIVQTSTKETTILSDIREDNDWRHWQGNINLSHQFENGAKLSTDFDYLYYKNENPTTYAQTFQEANGRVFDNVLLLTSKETPFDIQVGKVDYSIPVSTVLQLSVGGKVVQSNFENEVVAEEDQRTLADFTSASDLKENILAAYTEIDYQLSKKVRLKGGMRYEYSDSELNSTNGGKVVDRQFGEFFPSLFFNYQINSTNQLNLSYSRRINRPSFSAMAPFINFLSPNTSFSGNTALQPAIANTYQADYRYKTVNITLQYTQEDSTIANFQNRFDPILNRQIIQPDNLKEQQIFSASIAFPLKVNNWWTMRLFGQYTWQSATTIDEELGKQIFDQQGFTINGSQSFQLGKEYKIELTGFYQSTSLNGNVQFLPTGVLNIGLQKKLKNNARLTFNINDIFNSFKFIGQTDLPQEQIFVKRVFDFSHRTFRLTYAATFGNQQVKQRRKRNSGRAEKRRVN